MRECTGNSFAEWRFNSVIEIDCPYCGNLVEFIKDEIIRNCPQCKNTLIKRRGDYGFCHSCSPSSLHKRNFYSEFRKSKDLFFRRNTF